jgi:hypothetical protein
MNQDRLDDALKCALRDEVSKALSCVDGIEDRVLARLGERRPRLGFFDWFRLLIAPTRGGRVGQFAVLGATAAAFLVLGLFVSERVLLREAHPRLELAPSVATSDVQEVLFVLPALDATNVMVVGNFNSWEGTALADANDDGIWTARVPLPPGRYEYAFVIDGRWWGQDPLADEYVESFGEYSSVRYVGRGGDGA